MTYDGNSPDNCSCGNDGGHLASCDIWTRDVKPAWNQRCATCGAEWTANETLPCPTCVDAGKEP